MSLIKNTISVGALTFISRIFGYVRDVAIAYSLGASILNDAFIVALRLPNVFRSIFGEGAFSSAFIPIFNEVLERKGKQQAVKFAGRVQTLLVIILIIFCTTMMILMPYVIPLLAPGYSDNEEVMKLTINLGRITFPYILFISLMAFYGGIANSLGQYFAFASAPILMNLVLLVAAFIGNTPELKTYSLSYGLVIAGILEMLWVMYFVHKKFSIPKLALPILDEDIKKLFKRILPGIFGSGIAQINILVSTIIASFVLGGVSYLYYADRIYQLPLAIIGTALGTVLLPELSRNFVLKKMRRSLHTQNKALEFASFLTIPTAFGMAILAEPLVGVLFEHGEFTNYATINTAYALSIFAFGLPVYVVNKILTSVYFANGDTKTPVKIGILSVIVNIAISIVFLPLLKHVAVAIGSVIAAWLNAIILAVLLERDGKFKLYKRTRNKLIKMFIASCMMVVVLYAIKLNFTFLNPANELIILTLSGGIFYLMCVLLLRIYNFKFILKKLR